MISMTRFEKIFKSGVRFERQALMKDLGLSEQEATEFLAELYNERQEDEEASNEV